MKLFKSAKRKSRKNPSRAQKSAIRHFGKYGDENAKQGSTGAGWTTNLKLLANSKTVLKSLGEKYRTRFDSPDLIRCIVRGEIASRLRRTQRKNRLQALAAATAVYHLLASERDATERLASFIREINAKPPRGADVCRSLVECFFDYGTSQKERNRNRQYASNDALALRHIVRTGMEPKAVLEPDKGQNPTEWKRAEIEFQRQKKGKQGRTGSENKTKSPKVKRSECDLPSVLLTPDKYSVLKRWSEMGLVLGRPKKSGVPVAILVVPLTGLTSKEVKQRPDRVLAALETALEKAAGGPGARKQPKPNPKRAGSSLQRKQFLSLDGARCRKITVPTSVATPTVMPRQTAPELTNANNSEPPSELAS